MGPRLVRIGQVDASELERGQVNVEQTTGVTWITPDDTHPLDRYPFLTSLIGSGSRGAPLRSDGPRLVLPSAGGGAEILGPVATPLPTTNLTNVWPQLFPPGKNGGERPQTVASASTLVAAGATVTLIALPELPRGMAAVIKEFGHTAADFTNLTWMFRVKGRPADPIVAINFQFGALNDPHKLPGTGVELFPGDDFVVEVTNIGAAGVAGVRARVDLYQYQLFVG